VGNYGVLHSRKDMRNGHLITLEDITKIYEVGTIKVPALRGITMEIEQGELLAIMGPSGSGKSTLMNILGCLDVPSNGSYYLAGKDVSKMTDNQLAEIRNQRIGFVFQTFNLLPRADAFHNVELPLIYRGVSSKKRKDTAREALDRVGLADRIKHRPSELSGGQRQRVAIARALAGNPSLILADEPTGNLDSATGEEIMQLFVELHNEGNTIILVTHEDHIAKYAKRIIRLLDGMIDTDHQNGDWKWKQ
jgi:putative ABC transport system ATP-binding protein